MSFKRSSVSQSARPDATSKQVTGIENGSVYLGVGGWLAKSNDWLAHIAEAEDLLLGLAHSPMPVNLRTHVCTTQIINTNCRIRKPKDTHVHITRWLVSGGQAGRAGAKVAH